ncbi:NDP-hexose 2,3-dehydratase family protein [Nocardiopsis sp. MG754419]|uniref:NDP-hexose 2,3-dehydratase family protein n=1 Tax=Nocardiopsis sp. MG754419 TaxID=2259865 RepID=UPI001BA9C876|nr:NDP-hexose 2,3-dehydratase family protein [Nocardiopsis sp. MG754419]MBR8743446.1 NDP-hexose 2,3-dehydratase [Nocardiopsis sp. MG754419]
MTRTPTPRAAAATDAPDDDLFSRRAATRPALDAADPHLGWWRDRLAAVDCTVAPLALTALDRWGFDPTSGDLVHEEGHFFSVEGVRLDTGEAVYERPIIHQPEIGILGFLVKHVDGEPHCLVQAKMEPGNLNTIQLSPTVQATRSNHTRRHKGRATRYVDYFTGRAPGRVLVDVLQSEQGAWFWHKRNRNMVVEPLDEVEPHEDFRWIPLTTLLSMLRVDHAVNMDARTVLACMPFRPTGEPAGDSFHSALARSYTSPGPRAEAELSSWLNDARAANTWRARPVPLAEVRGWRREGGALRDDADRDFRIIGARVTARVREVAQWSQPLLEPRGQGTSVLVTRVVDGVLQVLVQARPEPGLMGHVEIGPTVQIPAGLDPAAPDGRVPYLREALDPESSVVRFDAVMSEEGGRFHHADTRYRIVEARGPVPEPDPERFRWTALEPLTRLMRHGNHVNVEARSLLACLHGLW